MPDRNRSPPVERKGPIRHLSYLLFSGIDVAESVLTHGPLRSGQEVVLNLRFRSRIPADVGGALMATVLLTELGITPNYTLEEVALELGVNRERVRQIEANALRKCRIWAAVHQLDVADLLGGKSRVLQESRRRI